MTDKEVMQQALHELEGIPFYRKYGVRISNAITALRTALEQPQAEPVAWVFAPNNELLWPREVEVTNPLEIDSYYPLYTTPPQRKPLTDEMIKRMKEGEDAYTKRGAFANGWLSAEAAHNIKD